MNLCNVNTSKLLVVLLLVLMFREMRNTTTVAVFEQKSSVVDVNTMVVELGANAVRSNASSQKGVYRPSPQEIRKARLAVEVETLRAEGWSEDFIDQHRRCRAYEFIADCMEDPLCMVDHSATLEQMAPTPSGGFSNVTFSNLGCKRNPHMLWNATNEVHQQLSCEPHLLPSRRPCSDPKNASDLERFKCLTSWLFPKWYDWTGNAVPATADDRARSVWLNDSYALQNVCVSPRGELKGWKPDIYPFPGAMETRGVYESAGPEFAGEFINRVVSLDTPPTHYYDTKVTLLLMTHQPYNSGHMGHRVVSTHAMIRHVYGEEALQFDATDSVVFYVATRRTRAEVQGGAGFNNGYGPYVSALGSGRWASIMTGGVPFEDEDYWYETFPRGVLPQYRRDSVGRSAMVCFKNMIVYDNCRPPCSDGGALPWEWSLFGARPPRIGEIGQLFRRKVAACLSVNLTLREYAETRNPTVFLAYRTKTRRLSEFNFILGPLVAHAKNTSGARDFIICEMYKSPMNDIMRSMLNADIMFGAHGALFTLSFLLANGAAVFEIATPHFSDRNLGRSWDTSIFGASYFTAKVRNSVMQIPEAMRRHRHKVEHLDWEVSLPMLMLMYDMSVAVLRADPAVNRHFMGDFHNIGPLQRISDALQRDADGDRLRAIARIYARPPGHPADDVERSIDCVHPMMSAARAHGHGFRIVELHINGSMAAEAPLVEDRNGPSVWRDVAQSYFFIGGWVRVETGETTVDGLRRVATAGCGLVRRDWEKMPPDAKCLVVVYDHGNASTATLQELSGGQCRANQQILIVALSAITVSMAPTLPSNVTEVTQ